ncbi:hypothetical protein ACFL5N_00555 [bacterium]
MKKITLLFICLSLNFSYLCAHLCNDVFIQAKDNLAVKVDIRDNQLRIGKEAEFRVYLLNTMDRDIDNIQLEIISNEFTSSVSPSKSWRTFPLLETKNKGGSKEYFIVKLIRKKETKEGKYKIGLRLFNGQDSSMIFKTVDINDAIGCAKIPKKISTLKIDGTVTRNEWKNSYLCANFYEYVTEKTTGGTWFKKHQVNRRSNIQTRVRFTHGNKKLYALIDFMKKGKNDTLKIYVAKNNNSKPLIINVNLQSGKAYMPKNNTVFKSFKINTKIELELPLPQLDLQNQNSFFLNLSRTHNNTITYWSGNETSVTDPIVYANFRLQ